MVARTPFQVVPDEPATEVPPSQAEHSLAVTMLTMSLKALSQKAIEAISKLFSLVLAGSVFFLAWSAMPNPTYYQITLFSLYAVFILSLHLVRKRA